MCACELCATHLGCNFDSHFCVNVHLATAVAIYRCALCREISLVCASLCAAVVGSSESVAIVRFVCCVCMSLPKMKPLNGSFLGPLES